MPLVLQQYAYLLSGVAVLLFTVHFNTPLSAQVNHPTLSQPAYHFNAYTKKDGLSTNSVWAITQDKFGFVWLGTDNGLYRFDGQEFLPFRHDPEDTTSISSNYITYFNLDRQQNLWVGTNNGLNRLNTETGQLNRIDLQTEGNLHVAYVLETREHQIWVGTMRNGLFRLDGEIDGQGYHIEHFEHNPDDPGTVGSARINHLIEDEKGHIWAGYPTGIDRIDPKSGKIQHFSHPLLAEGSGNRINDLLLDHEGNVLMTFLYSGVYYIQPSSPQPQIRPYLPAQLHLPQPPGIIYTEILIDQDKNFWLGTATHGLFLIDSTRSHFKIMEHRPEYSGSLSSSDIRAVYEDPQGYIWIGTGDAGLNRGKKIPDQYNWFQHDPEQPGSLADGQIRAIAEDPDGNIWIGYLGQGLEQFAFNQRHQLVKKQALRQDAPQGNALSSNDIIKIITDPQGFLWIATNGGGLNKLDPRTGRIEVFRHNPEDPTTISGDRIWTICVDHSGYIWLGTYWRGLCRLDPRTKEVKHFRHDPDDPNSLSSNLVNALLTDPDGYIWIGTDAGLDRMDPRTETILHFHYDQQEPHSLSNNLIFSLHAGPGRQLWAGTSIGLNRLLLPDDQTKDTAYRFERFYEKDGLPGNTIYSIASDQTGNLWVGTDNGLARSLPAQSKIIFALLNNEDGQEHAVYTPNAYLHHQKTGWLFFGNKTGLLAIHSELLNRINLNSRPVLSAATKMRLEGSAPESITNYFVSEKPNISLSHRDQIITLNLSDIYWAEGRTYEYQLSGFNDQWIEANDKMEITFTNLTPGDYALKARLKGTNNQPVEAVHLLDIAVVPPWWKTGWAYSLYVLLAGSLLFALYRFQLNRKLEQQETENLRALNEFKNQLYTNITHEFRTPLTVISGMIEQVEGYDRIKNLIKRNSASLLNLVNQILDLRKAELGKLELHLVQADVVLYLRYILESYEALAELKDIQLHFLPAEKELWMDFDKEKLLRIISNLLSNAIKFTPEEGNIYLLLEKSSIEQLAGQSLEAVQIQVVDKGIGIPKEEQESVFDRFYQAAHSSPTEAKPAVNTSFFQRGDKKLQYRGPGGSSGIGLALTKDLVSLMGGRIALDSEPGKGSTFT
ncbi:MAG: sensor histidine kinase, partial [Bacteroidetes bacterium]